MTSLSILEKPSKRIGYILSVLCINESVDIERPPPLGLKAVTPLRYPLHSPHPSPFSTLSFVISFFFYASLCSSNPPTLIFFSSFPLKAARSNPGTAQPAQRYYAVRLIDTRWIERTRVPNGVPRTSEGCKQTDG